MTPMTMTNTLGPANRWLVFVFFMPPDNLSVENGQKKNWRLKKIFISLTVPCYSWSENPTKSSFFVAAKACKCVDFHFSSHHHYDGERAGRNFVFWIIWILFKSFLIWIFILMCLFVCNVKHLFFLFLLLLQKKKNLETSCKKFWNSFV